MATRSNFELKVGLFVLIGVIMLGIIAFSVGEFGFMKKGYRIAARFGNVTGVEVGAPIRLSGVEVGYIESMRLLDIKNTDRYRVEMIGWVVDGIAIPEDSAGFINTYGLLGDKYLEIAPGKSQKLMPDGGVLYGSDPIPIDRVAEQGYDALGSMQALVNSVNEVVGDPVFRASVKHTVAHSEELTSSLRASSDTLKSILEQVRSGHGTLGRLLMDDTLYEELIAFVRDLKANPWKLLRRPKDTGPKETRESSRTSSDSQTSGNRGFLFSTQ